MHLSLCLYKDFGIYLENNKIYSIAHYMIAAIILS